MILTVVLYILAFILSLAMMFCVVTLISKVFSWVYKDTGSKGVFILLFFGVFPSICLAGAHLL